ncbi:MAG: GNAT family N-acetyltransferase [Burkholderiaceae bacterium]|nr:GNAT family N-acetyltransferase [Rhodoferax sp.]MCP5286231.1 GNAT family N-acetyltransferase [Burkholderiaceae bacterium]
MSTLTLAEIDDDIAWDAAIEASEQATVFARSAHLQALGLPLRRLAVRAGGRTVALLPLVLDATREHVVAAPFTPYLGPLFVHEPAALPRQRVLDEYRIGEFLVTELTGRYPRIAMGLHWTVQDLRPFLWHNYHEAGAPRFTVSPRYTAVLDVADADVDRLAADARACRRQELRKASAHVLREHTDPDEFLRLYRATFERQDIALPAAMLAQVRRITEAALAHGYGRLSACETPDGPASMNLFVYDRRRAYYLFAANDPAQRATGAATRLMFDNLAEAGRRGLAEVDFVGVNSPNRGDFKLSFNPGLRLYFDVALNPPP